MVPDSINQTQNKPIGQPHANPKPYNSFHFFKSEVKSLYTEEIAKLT